MLLVGNADSCLCATLSTVASVALLRKRRASLQQSNKALLYDIISAVAFCDLMVAVFSFILYFWQSLQPPPERCVQTTWNTSMVILLSGVVAFISASMFYTALLGFHLCRMLRSTKLQQRDLALRGGNDALLGDHGSHRHQRSLWDLCVPEIGLKHHTFAFVLTFTSGWGVATANLSAFSGEVDGFFFVFTAIINFGFVFWVTSCFLVASHLAPQFRVRNADPSSPPQQTVLLLFRFLVAALICNIPWGVTSMLAVFCILWAQ
jgi:hypothetical protein